MINKAVLVVLFVFLFLGVSSIGEATLIDNNRIQIDLKSDGSAHVNATVDYAELTSVDAPYIVFGNSKNFAARDSGGDMSCKTETQAYGTYYLCKPNVAMRKNYTVTFEFDEFYLSAKTADAYIFTYLHGASEPTKSLEVLLLLPEGTGVVNTDIVQPYTPDAVVGGTGRRVTLDWVIKPVELGKTYTFTANYEQVGQIVRYYGNYSRLLAILFALAFVFVLLKYKIFNRSSGKISISAMDVLKEDERKVMGIVMDSKDKCRQNAIVKGTNFSKAKVSRILADLEVRGLIKKIHIGRTNRVVLADKDTGNRAAGQTPENQNVSQAPSAQNTPPASASDTGNNQNKEK